jgi:hypothetical protein
MVDLSQKKVEVDQQKLSPQEHGPPGCPKCSTSLRNVSTFGLTFIMHKPPSKVDLSKKGRSTFLRKVDLSKKGRPF